MLSIRNGLLAAAVVTFLEELGEVAAGFAAAQIGTMMQPRAKSNVKRPARGRIRKKEEEQEQEHEKEDKGEEKWVRSCMSGRGCNSDFPKSIEQGTKATLSRLRK